MARERGGDPHQVDRPDSTSTLSHPIGDENGPQSAQASNNAAAVAVTGHPDQEIQTGVHQPVTAEEARRVVDREADDQLPSDKDGDDKNDRSTDDRNDVERRRDAR